MENNLVITPKTRVLDLIEAYPHLEDILIGYAPAFKKLKNPVLRRTVAKIATLQQAASIGNVRVEELVNRLRKEAGQDKLEVTGNVTYATQRPSWFREDWVVQELDARPMLNAGEHPVNQVISDLKNLEEGKIYRLIAPFLPAPLIDKATSLGFSHWVEQSGEEFRVYFGKEAK